MSRRHAGQYRKKHPSDTRVDRAVMEAVSSNMHHLKISCQCAFEISTDLSVAPSTVGVAIDLQEGCIISCQLGLFGYGDTKKKVAGETETDPAIETAIKTLLSDGRLSCKNAWQIADSMKIMRLKVAQACESMGVKICECQLGAF